MGYPVSCNGTQGVVSQRCFHQAKLSLSQRLVFAFDDLGIPIDNIEGMTFGPPLPDGRETLVIVSDNNFSAGQFTQFIVLALDIDPVD